MPAHPPPSRTTRERKPSAKRFRVFLLALRLPAPLLVLAACESPQPPVACGPLPQLTVNAGGAAAVLACFNDPNGDELAYSAISSNTAVATANLSGAPVFTVAAVTPGSVTVTIMAADPGGLAGTQTFQVLVPNRAPRPRGTLPPIAVFVGDTSNVGVSGNFSEPDGEALTYSAASLNSAVATVVSVLGSVVTVAAGGQGTTGITVTATDPGGLAATQTFQVEVPNRAPVVGDSIPDMVAFAGDSAEVNASNHFTDPDSDALAFTASTSDAGIAAVSVSGSTVTVTAVALGAATVTIAATDQEGASAELSFAVTAVLAKRLTDHTRDHTESPRWSPDGTKIAFGRPGIHVVNADGTGEKRLIHGDSINASGYRWSPDGARIAFLASLYGYYDGIHVMNADGDRLKRLTPDTIGSWRVEDGPRWSPDGARIAFVGGRHRQKDDSKDFTIYVMNADGTGLKRLTPDSIRAVDPEWSPDGTRIAFSGPGNWGGIYVMNADGTGLKRLNPDSIDAYGPRWSPDGAMIAFSGGGEGLHWSAVYVMNADGTGLKRLTPDSIRALDPEWSPDGTRIAFNGDHWSAIYLMNADGTGVKRLGAGDYRDYDPKWSPDGAGIAFVSHRDDCHPGNSAIYVTDVP